MLGEDTASKILDGDLSAYKGAIAENMVAASFAKDDRKLYYYHAPSGSPELDFLFEEHGNVIIVECKSSNNRATSMKFVIANQKKYGTHRAIKIADANIGGGDGFETYPLYYLGFIPKISTKNIVEIPDVSKIIPPAKN